MRRLPLAGIGTGCGVGAAYPRLLVLLLLPFLYLGVRLMTGRLAPAALMVPPTRAGALPTPADAKGAEAGPAA